MCGFYRVEKHLLSWSSLELVEFPCQIQPECRGSLRLETMAALRRSVLCKVEWTAHCGLWPHDLYTAVQPGEVPIEANGAPLPLIQHASNGTS